MSQPTTVPESTVSKAPWAMDDLPPFPAVATRLLHVLSHENASISEIAKIVAAEPVFATRVLQMANSPLFAIRQEVKAISQAINLLGIARVRAITVTRAMGDFVAPAINLKTLRLCWQNSLAGAILSEKLAQICRMDPDFAYVAGLVRDIGRLGLLIKYPREYDNLVAVSRENNFDLMSVERDVFDIDHCEAGAWVLKRMPMPPELSDVVMHHHRKPNGNRFRLVDLVYFADRMADALGIVVVTPNEPLIFEELTAEFEQASGASFGQAEAALKAEIIGKIQTWA